MNKVLFSMLAYSGSFVGVMSTGTMANPDTTRTLPYPEVMNLDRVPRFDKHGIVRATDINNKNLPARKAVVTKPQPTKIAKGTIARAISKPTLQTAKPNRVGDRLFAPTSVMVLGYSTPDRQTSIDPQSIVY